MPNCRLCGQNIEGISRTTQQNRFYWLCCRSIQVQANEMGNNLSLDEIHNLHKWRLLRKEIFVNGRPFQSAGTTRLSKQDFSELIEKIGAFWAEFGITIPNIEDYEKNPTKTTSRTRQ